ncbi:ArdC-like ssDNA-binding domain-containing protein [Cryobacterium sp. TMT2-14]|uniref:ArdC-like ssDNA-binding domain-containing protein n=1 Tax=Cryobacterium sp. TMT2-14 TaxID=1259245 RepID=UPI00106C4387|nr:ArdC-like ssDNA-binding domain-containing protein [Cryobacterium sp. TMT2-14]TFC34910.1 serine/arginine repetitive matrix protein 2 [Cryobacterium sp. TMT2-14]
MSTKPHSPKDGDAKLTELHERLVASVEALVTGNDWKLALAFADRFRTRSFNNALLIWAQHAAAYERGSVQNAFPSYVAGFKQWQELGRHVVAGQKGYMILAPLTARFATASPADAGAWRRLDRNERPRAGEVVRQRMVGVRPAYVWDVSQTDGSPIPERPAPILLRGEAPRGFWDGLALVVQDEGFTLLTVPNAASLGGANGRTDFGVRTVSVRADMDAAARVKTLAHELAHIHMHAPDDETLLHRGIREVEAESVALMIGAAHGMDTSDYTIPYVSSWASSVADKTATEVVQETGERVRRATVVILNQLQTDQIEPGDSLRFDRSKPTPNLTAPVTAPPDLPAGRLSTRSL